MTPEELTKLESIATRCRELLAIASRLPVTDDIGGFNSDHAAEAGWRATLAAIVGLQSLLRMCEPMARGKDIIEAQLRSIITAWEGLA